MYFSVSISVSVSVSVSVMALMYFSVSISVSISVSVSVSVMALMYFSVSPNVVHCSSSTASSSSMCMILLCTVCHDITIAAVLGRPLTSSELDQLLLLTQTASEGVPFSGSTPGDWREISLLQYHRQSPIHLHKDRRRGKKEEGAGQTSRIWQYQPPSGAVLPGVRCVCVWGGMGVRACLHITCILTLPCRYTFEVLPSYKSSSPIGSIVLNLTFANAQCLGEEAAVSLLLPKWDQLSLEMDTPTKLQDVQSNSEVLLGPVRVKPFVDVTGRSVYVTLIHPRLSATRPPILWLVVENLFASEFNEVSFTAEATSSAIQRGTWRTKTFRHHLRPGQSESSSKTKAVSVQVSVEFVCLFV